MASTSSSIPSTDEPEATDQEKKASYLAAVRKANYGSSGAAVVGRKRTRSNQENEPPNFIDDDEDDIHMRVLKRISKKPRRRTALDRQSALFADSGTMKGEPGSEHSYGCPFLYH